MKMTVDKERILSDYEKLKRLAKKSLARRNGYGFCSLCMQKAAALMYEANLFYADDDLESLLALLCESFFGGKPHIAKRRAALGSGPRKKRILFYDYFALDNRGLTEQYLAALFDFDCELFYIGCADGEKSEGIYKKLEARGVPFFVAREKNELGRAIAISDEIEAFCPDIILAHTSPWDVAGLLSARRFEGLCERWLINITDHAFWLGTKAFDYFLHFRNYGFNVSRHNRGIPQEKLYYLPYYPIVNDVPFEGLGFDAAGKKIIFSGGALYKIQGSPVYLEIVKRVLQRHEDAVFLYLGGGDFSCLEKFREENDFQGRVFFYPERKDVFQVFKRCDLYLNTYPLMGGLMTQYACMAGKIPITLNPNGATDTNNADELLLGKSGVKIQFETQEACEKALDFYLDNPEALKKDGEKLRQEIIEPKFFEECLWSCLNGKKEFPAPMRDYQIDAEKFAQSCVRRLAENPLDNYFSRFLCRDARMALAFFDCCVTVLFKRCVRKFFGRF